MNKNSTSPHSEFKSDSFRYWSEPAETLLHSLNSNPSGLRFEEAAGRLEEAGPNSLETRERSTPIVAAYFIAAEFTKRWFFRQVRNRG